MILTSSYTAYAQALKKRGQFILHPLGISRYSPADYKENVVKNLAPSQELLNKYKDGLSSFEEYAKEYTESVLLKTSLQWFMSGFSGVVPETADGLPIWESRTDALILLCYETSDAECHRRLLSEHLNSLGMFCREAKTSDFEEFLSATAFCNSHELNLDAFWARLMEEGLITDKKTPASSAPNCIRVASNKQGASWPIYSADILSALDLSSTRRTTAESIEAKASKDKKTPGNSGKNSEKKKQAKAERDFSVLTPLLSLTPSTKVLVYDVETTGFSPAFDDLLQITVESGHLGQDKDVFSTYVKPIYKKSWADAEAKNHISPAMVKDAPALFEIAPMVTPLFNCADVVVGHNVAFDNKFMKTKFGYEVPKEKVVDTLAIIKVLHPELENHKLSTVVAHYLPGRLEEFEAGAHNSDTDVKFTFLVFEKMVEESAALLKETAAEEEEIER